MFDYTPALTAAAMRDLVRSGTALPSELVNDALNRAASHAPLGAFLSLNSELAHAEALQADRVLAATPPTERTSLPALFGIPTAHKDLVRVRGTVTTHGSAAISHHIAPEDDPIAHVLRTAGTISIGKTQVPEFGIAGYSENNIAAPARNPYDRTRTSGGSSGGTAAAIAAGVIPAAIASDAGGSIRIPAAACGLIGLKPGRGVLPSDAATTATVQHGLLLPKLAVSGPMARTAQDAALFFDAAVLTDTIAHTGAATRAGAAETAVAQAESLRGLRIGMSIVSPFADAFDVNISAAALHALHVAGTALEQQHLIESADFHYPSGYAAAFETVWVQSLQKLALAQEAEAKLTNLAQHFLNRARRTTPELLGSALVTLKNFSRETINIWSAYDIIMTPALAYEAPPVGSFQSAGPADDYLLQCKWSPFTSMVNVTGLPAITVPITCTQPTEAAPRGIPVGVQFIGKYGTEHLLLQLAAQLTSLSYY